MVETSLKNSQIVLYTFCLRFIPGWSQSIDREEIMAWWPDLRLWEGEVWLNYLVVSSILALALLLFNQFSVAEVSKESIEITMIEED